MRNEEITAETGVMPNKDLMRRKRMQWYGHGRQRESEDYIRRVSEMTVEGVRPRGRPKQRLCATVNSDPRWLDLARWIRW